MKTTLALLSLSVRRAGTTAALTFAACSAVLLGGVSVQAGTTNYYWNVSSGAYTNDANWVVGTANFAPMGLHVGQLATGGSINYAAYVTNGGTVSYGDGGGGNSSGYTWTNVLGDFFMGVTTVANPGGTVNMNSDSLTISNSAANSFILAGGVNSVDNFNLSGGTLNVIRDAATFYQDSAYIGNSTNGTGTFTISGGVANFLCGVEIGDAGSGVFNVNGGVVVDNGWFGVGRGANAGTNSQGTFNLTSGVMYILRNTGNDGNNDNGVYLGQGSSNAAVNISGGTLYCQKIGMGGPAVAPPTTLNISGGAIYIGYQGVLSNGVSTESVNISGGTFHTLDMLQITTTANVGNTNTILADGTNWTWAAFPSVNLTNNTFAVNSVTGPGYITFAPEATRTITLNNQWNGVGGMVINGPGSVAMGEVNGSTYIGGTMVSQGTLIYNTAQPGALISGTTLNSGTTLALASAQTNAITGVAALDSGSTLALDNGGAFIESPVSLPNGVNLVFNETGVTTFTNILTGNGNVTVAGSGTINVGSNLQNTGMIAQNNGALVVNGTILYASSVTNSGPATVAPLLAQGAILPPLGIGTNSSLELGTTVQPGTLNASNVILDGTWIAKINTATTVGGGVNDLLICSNLIFNPSSVLSLFPQSAPSVGTYVLAEFVNCPNQVGLFTNATRDAISLNYVPASGNTLGQLQLVVGSSNPASLVWSATNFQANINWDVNTSSNWTNTATSALDTFHQQDAVAFNAVPGTGVTNRVSVTGQVLPSSITISGGLPWLFSGSGYISGGTGLNYSDTNVSGIYTAGNNYTGPVNINNGILQLGSGGSSWLGTSNTTTVNGGTLDLNAQGVGSEPLVIQGSGAAISGTNNGAINNSSSSSPGQSAGPLNVTLAGNTTLNASGNRWDIGVATLGAGGGSFAGNGNTLTKIGSQAIWMHEVGDTGLGNIVISNGLLGFEYTIGMGIPSDTVTVEPGATLGFYQFVTSSNENKQVVLNGSATLQSGGGAGSSNNFIGPITLNGTNIITTSVYPLNLAGNITGTGGFILSGTGPLYLGGNDTYSGSTVLGPGGSSIFLESGASIPDTSVIYLTPSTNTVLGIAGGVGAGGAITLSAGQTLEGAGSINAASFVAGPNSIISLGTNQTTTAYGTIIFTNNLTLNGDTNYFKISDNTDNGVDNDLIYVNQQLNLTGMSTLVVTPTTALTGGSDYTLIEAANGISGGSAANLKVISTSPRYSMTPVIGTAPLTGYSAVQVLVTGNAAPLEWKGYLTPNWDLVTSNWYNMSTAVHDRFYNGDDPTFDDTATVTAVILTNNVTPAGIFMSNVVNTYTFSGSGVIGGQLNMYGNGNSGGTLLLETSNAPAFTTIDSHYGNLIYDLQGLSNYTVNATIEDSAFDSQGNIIFGGTNIALLTADNYDAGFDGIFWVTNGALRYTNDDAFGDNNTPLIITNTGTLDFNQVPLSSILTVHISGTGFNGEGSLFDYTNNQEPNGAVTYLTLDGNASVGSPTGNRWDVHVPTGSPGQVNGQGFNLTKVGGGTVFFYETYDGDTHFGNIDVANGRLGFEGSPGSGYSIALGIPSDVLSVESNMVLTLYAISNGADMYNGLNKIMWLKGYEAAIDSGGASNNLSGPLFLTGTNLIGTRSDLHLWNDIMDSNTPGGFILANDTVGASAADLWLDGTNTYSGPTIISNRTVHVGVNSSLGLSRYVEVLSGAALDLSATPAYNFGTTLTNQTLSGNGTVTGPTGGNLTFNAGGALAVGVPATNGLANTNASTLTISGNVVFNAGSTNYIIANKTNSSPGSVPVGEVSGLTSLTLGGTLVITNYGTSFVGGDSLQLFSAATIITNAYTIIPATPGPNLAWNISTIPINGTLGVLSTITVNPNPTNILFSITGTNLTLKWPLDHTGWQLQAQTNSLAVGIKTNWVNVSGSTTTNQVVVPINLTNGCVFYRLTY